MRKYKNVQTQIAFSLSILFFASLLEHCRHYGINKLMYLYKINYTDGLPKLIPKALFYIFCNASFFMSDCGSNLHHYQNDCLIVICLKTFFFF